MLPKIFYDLNDCRIAVAVKSEVWKKNLSNLFPRGRIMLEKEIFHDEELYDYIFFFEKDSLKTSNFDIQANQERRKDIRGNIQWVFSEFVCKHQLKLSFDLDMDKLAQVLSTIAKCLAYPELNIAFTIKDTAALNEALLRETAMNAKHKAELLCEASDVKLGQLLTIDYDWKEFNIYSETNIDFMHQYSYDSSPKTKYMKMEPDSIHIKDTANYIWEIM